VTRTPFVRVGARARCEKCGARYVVEGSQVRRHKPSSSAALAVETEPGAAAEAGAEEASTAGLGGRDDDAPLGLTGLSDLLCREAGVSPSALLRETAAPPAAVSAGSPLPRPAVDDTELDTGTASRRTHRRLRARRSRDLKLRLILGGAATLLLGVAVVLVAMGVGSCSG